MAVLSLLHTRWKVTKTQTKPTYQHIVCDLIKVFIIIVIIIGSIMKAVSFRLSVENNDMIQNQLQYINSFPDEFIHILIKRAMACQFVLITCACIYLHFKQ